MRELASDFENEANKGEMQAAVGMVIFWPALFFLEGKNTPQAREYARLKGEHQALRVNNWASQEAEDAWQRLSIRDTTKGTLIVDVLHKLVWLWNGKENKAHQWHLIVRREVQSLATLKYSLSNAPAETSTDRLAFMQAQNGTGLNDYFRMQKASAACLIIRLVGGEVGTIT